jgi:4-hydroxy-3-polyprenylbenzoate decarboxylase
MGEEGVAKRLVVGMSGASGMPYGVRVLQALREVADVETHLVMTEAAKLNLVVETDLKVSEVEALADVVHSVKNISSALASGSFKTDGMIVAPCSMRTLAAIVHSYADNLLVRAADVVLKERRRLVVMPRETPLSVGHCKLLYEASLQGVIVCPPMPGFYMRPQTIDDLVDAAVGRALDLFDIETGLVKRWAGLPAPQRGVD